MSKRDELLRAGGAHVSESMGVGVGGGPLTTTIPDVVGADRWAGVKKAKHAHEIPVEKISPDPDQPREEFDEESLSRLAESMKVKGQLQPIRVRWEESRGVYVIICGERRWRAATLAGLVTMSAIVVEGDILPAELLAIQLVENCLREDLRPIEQARAFKALLEQNGWSVRQLARELALDHSGVAKALTLLELPPAVQEHVDQGHLPPTTAYEITKIEDPAAQEDLGRRAVAEKMTVAKVKEAVSERKDPKPRPPRWEHKSRNGCTVAVTLSDGADDDDIIYALQEAIKAVKKGRGRAA